jgi:pimeloyl-ACP methyl ester carboxylesterase
MKLHLNTDREESVKVRGVSYPVRVSGEGIPCLAIGIGTLMQRTLSRRFKSHFQVYSSDLYWDERFALKDRSSLTMDQIIEDIFQLGEELGLAHYMVFGHSAFGIVVLEFAKKYPSKLKGIIMVGTPVNSSPAVAHQNDLYFQEHASIERKKIDRERRDQFAHEDLTFLTPSQKFLRGYIWRDGPRYWHDPAFDCTPLWEGILVDEVIFFLLSM